jgi:hypothetical protein
MGFYASLSVRRRFKVQSSIRMVGLSSFGSQGISFDQGRYGDL